MSRQMTAGPASGRVMRQRTAGAVDGASSSQRAPRYRNATYTEVDDVQASHERMELVGEHSSTSDALLAPSPAQDVQRAQLSDSAVLDAAVVPQEQLHFSDLGPAAERAARRGDAGPFPALALDDAPLFGAAPRAWRRPAGTLGATGTAESGERNFLRVAQGLRVAPAARNDDEATATRVASLAQRMDALRQDVAAAVPPLFDVLETHVRRVAAERDAERVRREELQRGAESLALLVADMAGQAQAHPQAHVERERVAEAAPEPAAPARAAASEAPSESPARTVEAEFRQLGGGGHKPAAPVARGGVVEVASGSAVTGGGSGGTWSVGKRETTTQRPTAVRDYLPKDRPPDTEDYLRAQGLVALALDALAPDATPEKIMGAKTAIEAALRGGPAEPAPAPDAAGAGREDSATLAGDPMDQWARAALRRTEDRLDALMGIIQQRLPATPNAMGSDDAEDATRGYLGGGGARAAEASADATEGGVSVMESAELDGLIQRLRAMEAAEQRIRDRWLEPQREQSAAPVPESAPGPTAAPRTPGGAVASGRVAWGDVREEVGGGEGPVTQDMAKRVAAGRRAFLRRQQLLDSLLHAGGPKFDVGQAVEAVAEELLDEVIESTARNVDELTAEAVDALMAAELRGVR
ncbi:unnamed protein product [Pedinophyceae sp. YPF-701]|nr:unnamed protein product [Pedinophyceae sp. YPF-701]